MIMLGIGIAFLLSSGHVLEGERSVAGWVLVAIGAAYLVYYGVEGRKHADAQTALPGPRRPDA
jgi:threonine/homoserine/homoserine lactone efflux protein